MATATPMPTTNRPSASQATPNSPSASSTLASSDSTVPANITGLRPNRLDRPPDSRSPGTSPTTYAPSSASTVTAE
jgi:hypothetical protein